MSLKEARSEIALTKHAMRNGHQIRKVEIVGTGLQSVVDEIKSHALRTLAVHLLNTLERKKAGVIDTTDAHLEVKINAQLYKYWVFDLMTRKNEENP